MSLFGVVENPTVKGKRNEVNLQPPAESLESKEFLSGNETEVV